MNRLNQVKGMTQMTQSNQSINSTNVDVVWEIFYFVDFFGKRSNLLTFLENVRFRWPLLGYFEPIQLIQSYQSLKVNQLSHLLRLNHQSTHLEKELNRFNQFCWKNELIQVNQLDRVDWYTSLVYALFTEMCYQFLPDDAKRRFSQTMCKASEVITTARITWYIIELSVLLETWREQRHPCW